MQFLRIWAALSDCNFEVGERSEVGDLEGTTMSFNARTQSAQRRYNQITIALLLRD